MSINDGCCECDCGQENFGTAIVTCRYAPPVLEPAKHDLNTVAPFVSALVILHGCLALLSIWDAGAYPFVFHASRNQSAS